MPLPKGSTERNRAPPAGPGLVPRSVAEAWVALLVLCGTIVGVAYLAWYSYLAWLPAPVSARIAFGVIGVAAAFTLLLFVGSLVVHVVPAAFGVRKR